MLDDKDKELIELRAKVAQLEAQLEAQIRADYVKPMRGQRYDEEDDEYYRPGCGEYDTRDSKGAKLRPRVNEAGEPWWM
jgi:hypothetical protein